MSLGVYVRLRQDATWLAHVYHNLVIVHVFCEALHLIWTSHENSQLHEEQTQNVQQNLSYWNMFCVGFDIIRVCFVFLISKIPDGCFCAQDFISFWIFHLIYWIKVELCKGPLPALLVQKALVVHYTMTNATQHSNVKKGWFRNFLFWLHEKLEKLKHGLLEKVDEDFLL